MRSRNLSLGAAAALAAAFVVVPASAQQPPPPPAPHSPEVAPPPPPPPQPPPRPAPPPPRPREEAAPPQPVPPPSPVPAPTPAQLQERRLHVDIGSTRDSTVIERRVSLEEGNGTYVFLPYHSSNATWEQVCVTPCQVDLDRFSSYRVASMNHVAGSRTFTLPQSGNDLHLQVEAGDRMAHRAGEAMTGIGIAATVVGVALVAGAHLTTSEDSVRNAGFVTGGAGIVVMAVGIPLMIATSTHVVTLGNRIALTPRGVTF